MMFTHPTRRPGLTAAIVIAALGVNVWSLLLLVPVLHSSGMEEQARRIPGWLLALPLPFLILGIWRLSRVALLGLFPISLGLLNAVARGPAGANLFTVWTFGLAALSLFGYLVGATVVVEVQARRSDAISQRRLPLPPLSEKWRRRRRVYAGMAFFAALVPLSLIHAIDFHPATARALREELGPGGTDMQSLFVVGALGLWVWLFHTFFMQPLEQHRRGDADLRMALRHLKQRSGRRPRPGFYLVVLAALLMMTLLLWMRARYAAAL